MITRNDIIFRPLNLSDFSQVKEVSKDIWDGEDYVPQVFNTWINDPDSANFGLFLPAKASPTADLELIAYGRVKFYGKSIGWMEGGRVKSSYQKKGVGILLTEHAIQTAIENGCKIIQYATYTENHGSIALARRFGFIQKDYLVFLEAEVSKLKIEEVPAKNQEIKIPQLKVEEVHNFISKQIEEKPMNINTGFSFFPNQQEFFHKFGSNYKWFGEKDAVVRIEIPDLTGYHEGPEEGTIWVTIYGESETAFEILSSFIQHYNQTEKIPLKKIILFLPKKNADYFLSKGFSYDIHQEPDENGELKESGVLLFEKKV